MPRASYFQARTLGPDFAMARRGLPLRVRAVRPGCENALDPKMTNQRVDREGGRNISAPWAANSEPCPQKGLTDPIEKSTSVIVA